eukprot:s43_g54.t1
MFKTFNAGDRAPARPKGATFPFREGELAEFISFFRRSTLDDAISDTAVHHWSRSAWVYLTMASLNVLAGASATLMPGRWTRLELQAVKAIGSAVDRRFSRDSGFGALTESDWQKDRAKRSVGYSGEEISICHVLTWDQLIGSLPPEGHGGAIDALDWVSGRTREFLLNPEYLLKEVDEVVLPRMPGKVHVASEDKLKIATELVKRRICDWIPLSAVHEHKGCKVLNGLFGVSKPTCLSDGTEVGYASEELMALSCAVIPMGWLNSVGVMQEISEALVRHGGLNLANQIFRGRTLV